MKTTDVAQRSHLVIRSSEGRGISWMEEDSRWGRPCLVGRATEGPGHPGWESALAGEPHLSRLRTLR